MSAWHVHCSSSTFGEPFTLISPFGGYCKFYSCINTKLSWKMEGKKFTVDLSV